MPQLKGMRSLPAHPRTVYVVRLGAGVPLAEPSREGGAATSLQSWPAAVELVGGLHRGVSQCALAFGQARPHTCLRVHARHSNGCVHGRLWRYHSGRRERLGA